MTSDEDGVISPRLRPVEVARRAALFCLLGVVLVVVTTLSIADHGDRQDFLTLVAALSLFGALFLVMGGGFWWASAGDIRRWRDWHTIKGQAASVTLVGPVFLRSGVFLLVLGAAGFGLYHLVDAASYDSWMHSR